MKPAATRTTARCPTAAPRGARPCVYHVADLGSNEFGEELGERDVLRGRALTRVLEEREQCQQQQNNNDPEGEIAQIGVHRSSFVVARIAALFLGSVLGQVRGNPSVGCITI